MSVHRSLVLAALAVFLAAGCTEKRDHAEQRNTRTGEEVRTPSGSGSPDGSGGAGGEGAPEDTSPPKPVVDPSLSPTDIFSRIHELEAEISQIIAAQRLSEVRAEATRIAPLVEAAAERVKMPPNRKSALDGRVAAVKGIIGALSDAGDAGDLVETKKRNSELQKELGVVERMIVQSRS